MLRSQINTLLVEAEALLRAQNFMLPPFAGWSQDEWRNHPQTAEFCRKRQMGWDVTDFGSGDFVNNGLLLFCIRNGIFGKEGERGYAEKILIVQENQLTPWHYHMVKMEDIICRGGGVLVIECHTIDAQGQRLEDDFDVLLDGVTRRCKAGEPIHLHAGQSITLPRRLAHCFYGLKGHGTVLAGEVSDVNDDLTDNYFLPKVGRFAKIEEDVAAKYPLWSEIPV